MFSVRITSKLEGRDTSAMAAESTYMCDSSTPGKSFATRFTTSRHKRDESSTLALSTDVSFFRRRCANSNASRAMRSTSGSVYAIVSTARRFPGSPDVLRSPK